MKNFYETDVTLRDYAFRTRAFVTSNVTILLISYHCGLWSLLLIRKNDVSHGLWWVTKQLVEYCRRRFKLEERMEQKTIFAK